MRKFYEVIKEYVGLGLVDRVFITGIAPLTLDAITSGFNIASNLTFAPELHDMLGFREDEVELLASLLRLPHVSLDSLKRYYDGYSFDLLLRRDKLWSSTTSRSTRGMAMNTSPWWTITYAQTSRS